VPIQGFPKEKKVCKQEYWIFGALQPLHFFLNFKESIITEIDEIFMADIPLLFFSFLQGGSSFVKFVKLTNRLRSSFSSH